MLPGSVEGQRRMCVCSMAWLNQYSQYDLQPAHERERVSQASAWSGAQDKNCIYMMSLPLGLTVL